MYCTNCGNQFSKETNFCAKCGNGRNLVSSKNQFERKPLVVTLIVLVGISFSILLFFFVFNSLESARQEGLDSVIQLDMDELGEFADNFVADCIASGGTYNESTATCIQ